MKGVRRPTRPLMAGDSIRLVRTSLSAPFAEWEEVRARLSNAGFLPILDADPDPAFAPYSDSDKNRLKGFMESLTGREAAAMLSFRGGSGGIRLLGEWERLARGLGDFVPAICGFSDMTYLHAALASRMSLATFWGPNARELRDRETFDLWLAMLSGKVGEGDPLPLGRARTLRPGRAFGPLLGGNLESLAHLSGTPFMPDFSGAILLVEDIDEPLYAIDRALRTLSLSGRLNHLAGMVVGPFSEIRHRGDDPAEAVSDLILPLVGDIPVMEASLPGHGEPMATWPLNVSVDLLCPEKGPPFLRLLESPFEDLSDRSRDSD